MKGETEVAETRKKKKIHLETFSKRYFDDHKSRVENFSFSKNYQGGSFSSKGLFVLCHNGGKEAGEQNKHLSYFVRLSLHLIPTATVGLKTALASCHDHWTRATF